MKIRYTLSIVLLFILNTSWSKNTEKSGFFLEEPYLNTVIEYESVNDMVILPVTVNGKELKLILDTGVRGVVLFGRKFNQYVNTDLSFSIRGWGGKGSHTGKLSTLNQLNIGKINGNNISMLVFKEKYIIPYLPEDVDGIIGYELFWKFQVNIDPACKKIIIGKQPELIYDSEFKTIPITLHDTKPYLKINLKKGESQIPVVLMVDTGAEKEVLLNKKRINEVKPLTTVSSTLGYGIGGAIKGYEMGKYQVFVEDINLGSMNCEISDNSSGTEDSLNADGVLGIKAFKNYSIIFDYGNHLLYLKQSACFPVKTN